MIRVVIADDEPLVRAGLRLILASDPAIDVVAEAADGRSALEAVDQHRPDVVLLDIQMPGLDGLSAAARLRERAVPIRVIMVTTFDDDRYLARALTLPVDGFLLKSADPYELIAGVKAAMTGGTALSPSVARRLVQALRAGDLEDGAGRDGDRRVEDRPRQAGARERVESLTVREQEVLALVGAGLANGQIARRLHLVEGTVKVHVSSILAKLGLDNRVRLAVLAHEAGIVPDQ